MLYVRPKVTGRAWITGFHQFVLDPEDPLPEGFRIGFPPRAAPDPERLELSAAWTMSGACTRRGRPTPRPGPTAVRGGRIASRVAATDRAIVEAVGALRPARVLDVGCGEGWLARRLHVRSGWRGRRHRRQRGADRRRPRGAIRTAATACLSYRRRGPAAGAAGRALRRRRVQLRAARRDLWHPCSRRSAARSRPSGALLIQTLHPWAACGELPYRDGWREETFAGFGEGRWQPMPWYFRTLASWLAEIAAAGLAVARCREPLDPASGRPLSLLLSCRARG